MMKRHPKTAKFLYRRTELISWLFTILLFVSLINTGISLYNYVEYGNCNGPVGGGFCIFDPTGQNSQYSGILIDHKGKEIIPGVDDDPSIGDPNAKVTVIEFGCYICPFTRSAQPMVEEMLTKYGSQIFFVFRDFPLDGLKEVQESDVANCEPAETPSFIERLFGKKEKPQITHPGSTRAAVAAYCALQENVFWEYHRALLASPELSSTRTGLLQLAERFNLDTDDFETCLDADTSLDEVTIDFEAGVNAGIYGTPTFFVNGKKLVAPSEEELKKALDEALA